MTQDNQQFSLVNSHVEDYLDDYCGLSHPPEFAILLKGEWGCGKTWFIDQYCKKLEEKKQKFLYVSLYGMTSFSEIENAFFQQLHPLLASKGMAITGKILQGVLKASLKIDLNNDGQDNGNVSLQIPKINLPESFTNADKSILIFDDLERCKIDIGNILGYINSFVEHQGLKVVLVANESELLKNHENNYKDIKEKLIGKTFDITRDLRGALNSFIQEIDDLEIKNFLLNNTQLIEEIYLKTEYENLRSLKQIILDFERIFQKLPEKAKSKQALLQEILQLLLAFSIQIKGGALLPKNINRLEEALVFKYTEARRNYFNNKVTKDNQDNLSNASNGEDRKVLISLKKIIDKYEFLNLLIYEPLPNLEWWQTFLDKGIINVLELEESILNSKYFQDENTPDWIRLWHFLDLSDEEFDVLLRKVELNYEKREFIDIREIKHVTGLLIKLSDIGLYSKSKQELLQNSKLYIDDLINTNKINLDIGSDTTIYCIESMTGYRGLGYQGKELTEFKEFCSYIKTARQSAIESSLPELGLKLLEIMQDNSWEFRRMICLNNSSNTIDDSHQVYFEIPIFQYIKPDSFMEKFVLLNFEDKRTCFSGIKKRYEFKDINKKLLKELSWLIEIKSFFKKEYELRKGKLSGHIFELFISDLEQAIEALQVDTENDKSAE